MYATLVNSSSASLQDMRALQEARFQDEALMQDGTFPDAGFSDDGFAASRKYDKSLNHTKEKK